MKYTPNLKNSNQHQSPITKAFNFLVPRPFYLSVVKELIFFFVLNKILVFLYLFNMIKLKIKFLNKKILF
jgi:hypothetical protein